MNHDLCQRRLGRTNLKQLIHQCDALFKIVKLLLKKMREVQKHIVELGFPERNQVELLLDSSTHSWQAQVRVNLLVAVNLAKASVELATAWR